MHTITKQPWETFPVAIDFSGDMIAGEVISLANSEVEVDAVTVENPMVVAGSLTVVDGTKLQVTIYGGVPFVTYKVNFRAYINTDKKLEDDLNIIIEK